MKLVFTDFAKKFPAAADSLAHQLPPGLRKRALEIARAAQGSAAPASQPPAD